MSTQELRAEARIPVTQRGRLSAGDAWFPCMVLDMSSSGFLMVSNKQLAVGQTLDFRCELYPGKFLDCMIEVMHSHGDSAGMLITEIDDNGTGLLHLYLEEKYAVKLDTRPKARPREEQ
jgi:hypothetical protein